MKNNKFKELVEELNSTKFELRDTLNISDTETFGIEVEFENVNLKDIKYNKGWKVTKDDSVTTEELGVEKGGEVSSPILKDDVLCWQNIDKLCKYLSKKGAVATPKTGGHIHIGSQILKDDPDNIRKFFKQWEYFENIIYLFSSGKDNTSRPSIKTQANMISEKLNRIRNSKYGYSKYNSYYDWIHFFRKYSLGKFCGVNFKNYKGYEEDIDNTIEIRCPNGTIDSTIWQNNINFFTKFIQNCTNKNFDEEYIDYLLRYKNPDEYNFISTNIIDVDKAIELADFIFEDRIDKIMFLKQYLKMFETEPEKQYTKK